MDVAGYQPEIAKRGYQGEWMWGYQQETVRGVRGADVQYQQENLQRGVPGVVERCQQDTGE